MKTKPVHSIVITSDTHDGKARLPLQASKAFEQIVQLVCTRHARGLVHGGDWFESRGRVPTLVYNRAIKTLYNFFMSTRGCLAEDIPIWTVVGNHDLALADGDVGDSALYGLSELFPYLHVGGMSPLVEHACGPDGEAVALLHLFGYSHSTEELYRRVEDHVRRTELAQDIPNIAVLHQVSLASETPSAFILNRGVDVEFLSKRFDFVVIGDNHKPQLLLDNVLIPGIPYASDFADGEDERGVWVLKIKGRALADVEFVPLDGPKFVSMEINAPEDLPHKFDRDNFYRLFVPDTQMSRVKAALGNRFSNVTVVPVTSVKAARLQPKSVEQDIVKEYVRYVNPEGLDRKRLEKMGREFLEGA